ncbi:MAG: hypothetical protein NTY53_03685 [Kiritimatiellaeota bacterium]|nr:hypothetical protein [Kiritimatiellota bacterium]
MGYHMTQRDARFHLPRRHFKAALKAVRQLLSAPIYAYHDSPARQRSLPKVLPMLGWEVEQHAKTGDIVSILFTGEKAHEDWELFKALAPFVTKGSSIAMDGEDGCLWRWWFNGQRVREQYGHVVYK